MKPLFFGAPSEITAKEEQHRKWVYEALQLIELASQEDADIASIAQDFTVENYTATRTLDASTATATDVADVLCTLIDDIKNRGMKRTS